MSQCETIKLTHLTWFAKLYLILCMKTTKFKAAQLYYSAFKRFNRIA